MLNKQTKIFKSLADPNRIRILKMLQVKSLCVCEITEILGLAASTVSEHLNILRKAGFVNVSKEGKWINYYLKKNPSEPELASLMTALHFLVETDPVVIKDRKMLDKVDRLKIKGMSSR